MTLVRHARLGDAHVAPSMHANNQHRWDSMRCKQAPSSALRGLRRMQAARRTRRTRAPDVAANAKARTQETATDREIKSWIEFDVAVFARRALEDDAMRCDARCYAIRCDAMRCGECGALASARWTAQSMSRVSDRKVNENIIILKRSFCDVQTFDAYSAAIDGLMSSTLLLHLRVYIAYVNFQFRLHQ